MSLRMRLGYALGERSPFAHLDPSNFDPSFVRRYKHGHWVASAGASHENSRELFVQHFNETYEGHLPIWALTELLQLGQLAVLYGGLRREISTEVAEDYGVPTKKLFRSWLASINEVRNISAHHSRLFNRKLVYAPKRPASGKIPELEHLRNPDVGKGGFGVYNTLAVVAHLLSKIERTSTWSESMSALALTFPSNPRIGLESMGFPEDWEKLALWRSA